MAELLRGEYKGKTMSFGRRIVQFNSLQGLTEVIYMSLSPLDFLSKEGPN